MAIFLGVIPVSSPWEAILARWHNKYCNVRKWGGGNCRTTSRTLRSLTSSLDWTALCKTENQYLILQQKLKKEKLFLEPENTENS